MEIKELVKRILRYNKDSDITLINKAYSFAEKNSIDKKRLSGRTYLDHYLEVASEIANLKLDDDTICATLLQGVIKDKKTTIEELKKEFNSDIAFLVEGISKINYVKKNVSIVKYEVESIRKLLLVISKDIRILFIKLCDKLINMRDLSYLKIEERKRIAEEVLEVYSPLAYRLGLSKIKSELEDMAFKELDIEMYNTILKVIEESKNIRETKVFTIKRVIEKKLKEENIDAYVYGRAKSVYSIYRKTIVRNKTLEEVTDLTALRIIVKDNDSCYKVLRIIHELFIPIPGKFTDHIAMPKENGYRSLHTAVLGKDAKPIEFQIRTEEMHEKAESGVASHFSYKGVKHDEEFDKKLDWLKQLAEHEKNLTNKELLDLFKIDFFSDVICVFTPKGKMVELIAGSTPLDFAYNIHSDLGDKCIGAKVNGKMTALKDELKNGDIIEILTNKSQEPSRDWLKIVRTSKARSKIKQALRREGKTVIVTNQRVIESKKGVEEGLIVIENFKDCKIEISKCCNPLPGDKIIGIISSNKRIKIHKEDCKNLNDSNKKRAMVRWRDPKNIIIELIIDGEDRVGLFAELSNCVSSFGVSIIEAKGKIIDRNKAECRFKIKTDSLQNLIGLIDKIKKVKAVRQVYISF